MSIKIELECCQGKERYSGQCLRDRCPVYREAKSDVNRTWPRMPTGFGNAWGEPRHKNYISEVINSLRETGFKFGKRHPGDSSEGNPI